MAKNATTTNSKTAVIAALMKELNADEIAALAKLGNGASTDEVFAACPTLASKLMKNPDIIKGLAGEADAEAAEDDSDDASLQLAILKKENARLRKQAAKKSSKKSKDEDEDDDDDDEDEDDGALFTVRIKDDWSWNRVGEIVLGATIVSALTIGAVYAINALSEK